MKSAYISCPMIVSQAVLDEVIELVEHYEVNPQYWHKGTSYNEDLYNRTIVKADAFILILPALTWACEGGKMTSGSRKELTIAVIAKKPIYIAYRNKNDGLGIYAADVKTAIDGNSGIIHPDNIMIVSVTGIASTRYNFRDNMQAATYVQREGRVNRNAISNRNQANNISQGLQDQLVKGIDGLNKHKSWIEATEELYRQGLQQSIERAISPAWINTSAIPLMDAEKLMKIYEQCGIMYLNSDFKPSVDLIADKRILLFF